ncbi:hypothetical protein [Saccharothrix obliqua]|uniref:hypothetical protein n=1 Tax=Saccharothrix obliqua TaxID=2861747 RepID=UPI001C5ECF60|nr:hypothetical protein [Saccharothrix obliqua]MBW4721752.1 hypothetical protein [Saccharothrix obliqua]
MGLWGRLFGSGAPAGFTGALEADERVLASAATGDGFLVATSLGLWLPGPRRVGWHLLSKAVWRGGALTVVEAEEDGVAGEAVVLRDLPPVRYPLATPGKVPEVVHARVTASIRVRHRHEEPGAWFLQRKVPGRDGVVLQVRPDAGVDVARVRRIAEEVAAKIARLKPVD